MRGCRFVHALESEIDIHLHITKIPRLSQYTHDLDSEKSLLFLFCFKDFAKLISSRVKKTHSDCISS